MLIVALVLCLAGPVALRLGWQRAPLPVGLGWGALGLAAVLLARGEGAWGLALGATCAMACATLILAQAGLVTPGPRRVVAERPGLRVPSPSFDPVDLARRIGVFLIVAVLDLAASLLAAWGVQRALFRSGMDEADAIAIGLFALPLLWAALASWQMMLSRLAPMALAAAGVGSVGGVMWLVS